MEMFLNVVPVLGIAALIFAGFLAAKVNRQEPKGCVRSHHRSAKAPKLS